MLRIDVESVPPVGAAYAIPPGNPFVGIPNFREEIWAYGLRNPFRFSFDRVTGDLYSGDVGQALFEELNIQPVASSGGENYGWNIMEGSSCYNAADPFSPLPACDMTGLTLPVLTYSHASGDCAIIGGFVYRGQVASAMRGLYFYSDECTGRMWGLRGAGPGIQNALLFDTPFLITSFGEDQAGQLYVTSYLTGEIFSIGAPGMATGDFNGDGRTDFAFLNVTGDIFYSTASGVFVNLPGSLMQIVAGNFTGTVNSGIAGLDVNGTVWASADLATFQPIPGAELSTLVSGDFNGNGTSNLAGLASNGSSLFTTNLSTWITIPFAGFLPQMTTGNVIGTLPDDLVGVSSDGSLWQSADLTTWTSAGPVRGACHNPAVRLSGTFSYFANIQLAYDSATTGQTVLLQGLDFTEAPNLNKNISVSLTGGYGCDYVSNPGFTAIHSVLTISIGSVTMENMMIL